MSDRLKAAIVRILSKERQVPVGAGFLISHKHVLTCSHVIAQALGLQLDTQDMPVDIIHLDFPLAAQGKNFAAQVVYWMPTQLDTSKQLDNTEDIAILELKDIPPETVQPAKLIGGDDFWGHTFRAFGFPAQYDKGVWASGILRDRQATGWVQIEDVKVPGYPVIQGFSGTPVWDEQMDGVVGMVVESDSQIGVKAAYIIPTTILVKAWPQLERYVVDDLKDYLERLYKRLSALPGYYPAGFDFDHVRQRVRMHQKRLYYREEEAKERERNRRKKYLAQEEERRKKLEQKLRFSSWVEELDEEELDENEETGGDPEEEPDILEWEKIRKQIKRCVILGDPGSGKSWLLQYEGRLLVQEQLGISQQESAKTTLPIYVHLGALAEKLTTSEHTIEDAILRITQSEYRLHRRFVPYVRQKLYTPQCVLLLDALDEVAEDKRTILVQALKRFSEYSQSRILLTSRIVGYTGSPFVLKDEEQERELDVVGFDKNQALRFIESWFVTNKERGKDLREKLRYEVSLRSMSRIPLLLSFICLAGTGSDALPASRAKLYQTVIRLFLEAGWKDFLQAEKMSRIESKLKLLEEVAWHFATLDGQWHDLLSVSELNNVIQKVSRAEYSVRSLGSVHSLVEEVSERDGILVKAGEPALGVPKSTVPYLFLHRSIHEYLVASHLSKLEKEKWLDFVKLHFWFDQDWEEVIVLLAGCLQDPNPLIEALLTEPYDVFSINLLLAGRCFAESNTMVVRRELTEHMIAELEKLSKSASGQDQDQAEEMWNLICSSVAGEWGQVDNPIRARRMVEISPGRGRIRILWPPLPYIRSLGWLMFRKELQIEKKFQDEYQEEMMNVKSFKILIATLEDEHKDPLRRAAAAKILGKIEVPQAIDALLIALRAKDEDVYDAAGEALEKIGLAAIEGLLVVLQELNVDISRRLAVVEILERLGTASVEGLLSVLRNSRQDGRSQTSAGGLWGSSRPLHDDNWKLCSAIAQTLGRIGNAQAMDGLLPLLEETDEHIRYEVAKALGQVGEPAVEGLLLTLRNENGSVKEAAAMALQRIGEPAVEGLRQALYDPDLEVRSEAISALAHIGDSKVVPDLLIALKDESRYIVRHAIKALGQIGDEQAVEDLRTIVRGKDTRPLMLEVAVEALGQIDAWHVVEDLLEVLRSGDKDERLNNHRYKIAAIKALGQIGDPQAIDHLLTILQDENGYVHKASFNEYVHKAAIKTLGQIGNPDPRVIESLLTLLRSNDRYLQGEIVTALGQLGDARVVEDILPLLWDDQESLQLAAEEALKKLLQRYDIPLLFDHLFQIWNYEQKDRIRVIIFNLMAYLSPHLFAAVEKDWFLWRTRLMPYTRYILEARQRGKFL